ncbi:MAG: exo-alpha-sialidase [Acidobacteriota bacterium]
MKHLSRQLVLALILIISGALLALIGRSIPGASAQVDDEYRWLYDNDELFNQLSGAARSGLEVKFGKKVNLKDTKNKPLRPKTQGSKKIVGNSGVTEAPGTPVGNDPLSPLGNTLVNDPNADVTSQDTQSETALVIGSGSNVIAAFNDSGSFLGAARKFTGYSRSTDGAATWTDKGSLPSGSDGDVGDPNLARSNSTATIFLSTLSFNTRQNLLIFRSTDDGATFQPPVNAAPGFSAGVDFQDKEWLAVDNFPGPGQGNVYAAWRNFSNTAQRNGITFTRSTDDGLSWGPTGGTLIDSLGQGTFLTVGPDHAVYLFWWNANSSPFRITMRKSTDQGATFGPITAVATLLGVGGNGDLGLNGGFRTNSFPQAAVNPVNGNLYVVYNDRTTGSDRANILFAQSTDGGSTWSGPVTVNTDGTINDQYMPALALTPDGASLCITFYDRRRDPFNSQIDRFGVIGSISGSAITFGPNFLITNQSFPVVRGVDPAVNTTYMGDYDMMAADSNFFYTTWGDNRDQSIAAPSRKNANVRSAKIPIVGPGAILTLAGTGLPTGGNGNGVIDRNECNNLNFTLRNFGSSPATGVSATLSTTTPGVSVSQALSAYPDIAVNAKDTNTTPFQLSTSPSFPCGSTIALTLTVTTVSGGTSIIPFQMATGSPSGPVRINNNTTLPIPDLSTVESPVTVSGVASAISQLTVSLFITHTFDHDLINGGKCRPLVRSRTTAVTK